MAECNSQFSIATNELVAMGYAEFYTIYMMCHTGASLGQDDAFSAPQSYGSTF